MISPYLPKQMNGPILKCLVDAVNKEYEDAQIINDYLYGLSIDTAQETELENIGRLIGFVRPLVPEGFNEENILLLGPTPIETDPEIGLSALGVEIGGILSTVTVSDTGFMTLGTYRKFLKSMARLKRYGITLSSIDSIVSIVSSDYEITYNSDKDIVVHFTESIGYKNLWILTQLFYKIATAPQVLITSGEGE